MGWFDKQIKARIKNDDSTVENVFYDLAAVVAGKSRSFAKFSDERLSAQSAVEEICKYYKAPIAQVPKNIVDLDEQLEYLLRPSGIMRRDVTLREGWWKDAIGPMLGKNTAGDCVALMPLPLGGYQFFDHEKNKHVKVNRQTQQSLQMQAICFYPALPQKPLTNKELLRFVVGSLTTADLLFVALAALVATLMGMLLPWVNSMLFTYILPSGEPSLLVSIAVFMVGITVASFLVDVIGDLLHRRISTKLDMVLQSAAMARLVNMPVTFFKGQSAGGLSNSLLQLSQICSRLSTLVLEGGLSTLFGLAYIVQIARITPSLALPTFVLLLVQLVFGIVDIRVRLRLAAKEVQAENATSGVLFALYSGIQKIKLAGAENRAFAKWGRVYKNQADAIFNPPLLVKLEKPIFQTLSLVGLIVLYFIAATAGVSVAEYMAFSVAYGTVTGTFSTLLQMLPNVAFVAPVLKSVQPLLQATPEVQADKKVMEDLSGIIEISNLSFRYEENSPLILDNLGLKIHKGQYVAVVGKSGSGKSTLMRLLLGFEQPLHGTIFYDGQRIEKIDLRSLRRHIGVVLQNGGLFSGDVFSNIAIASPNISLEEAWEAAEIAGLAEDIRNMPMGMNTVINSGVGGVSGGQKQRIMIARAIASKPKVLMMDEATSALDNLTQLQVSQSLEKLQCTRIVIAHRLSTIKQCDRIIVLDEGRIIEDGSYDELLEKKGVFAGLVERQQVV